MQVGPVHVSHVRLFQHKAPNRRPVDMLILSTADIILWKWWRVVFGQGSVWFSPLPDNARMAHGVWAVGRLGRDSGYDRMRMTQDISCQAGRCTPQSCPPPIIITNLIINLRCHHKLYSFSTFIIVVATSLWFGLITWLQKVALDSCVSGDLFTYLLERCSIDYKNISGYNPLTLKNLLGKFD